MTITTSRPPVDTAILKDIQSIEQSAIIELFELDVTDIFDDQGNGLDVAQEPGPDGIRKVIRFHAGANEFNQNVIWGAENHEYIALPVEAEGFDVSVKGTLPRPKIRIANTIGEVSGIFNAAILKMNDLIGAKLTRRRTYAKYLNAQNFLNGNPDADPNKEFPEDIFYIEQKTLENRYVIEWELVSKFDLSGVLLPRRQVVQNSCHWRYRGAECSYNLIPGGMFTVKDVPITNPDEAHLDACSKTLQACRKRFGNSAILPYGGFPGARRYD